MRADEWLQKTPPHVLVLGLALLLAISGAGLRATTRPAGDGEIRVAPGLPLGAAPVAATATAAHAVPVLPDGPVQGRVGLQVGHWRSEELPPELAALREQRGARAGDYAEVDLNLQVARQVAALLTSRGVTVDILPATIPPGYAADVFVALHCDINDDPAMRGYKLARFRDSPVPAVDDALLTRISTSYAAATRLPTDSQITRNMTGYYAFNSVDYQHTLAPGTPGVLIELGFLSNPADLDLLVKQQQLVALGVADGILRFLLREGPALTGPDISRAVERARPRGLARPLMT